MVCIGNAVKIFHVFMHSENFMITLFYEAQLDLTYKGFISKDKQQ